MLVDGYINRRSLAYAPVPEMLSAIAMEAVNDGILITDVQAPDLPILYAGPSF